MNQPDVTIVDGGGANIASLRIAFERLGASSALTADPDVIRAAERVVLPGVGAAAAAMQRLETSDLLGTLPELDQPVLGICLGMQLFGTASAENDTRCLGIFPGRAAPLKPSPGLPVPNMGWCPVGHERDHPLTRGIPSGEYFYFVHGFAMPVDQWTIGSANHSDAFAAIAARDNFVATQFHPERSGTAGAKLLQNFLEL